MTCRSGSAVPLSLSTGCRGGQKGSTPANATDGWAPAPQVPSTQGVVAALRSAASSFFAAPRQHGRALGLDVRAFRAARRQSTQPHCA